MSDVDQQRDPQAPIDLSHYLAKLAPRSEVAKPIEFAPPNRTLVVDRGEDLAAVAVALLMLERVAGHGGCRIPVRVVRPLRERAVRPFQQVDVMAMEVEAYNTLQWLAGLEQPQRSDKPAKSTRRKTADLVYYDPTTPPIDLLRRAIDEEFDVEIIYYTQSRGQLNKRRISPNHIEAETYLHAYCHTRRDDRVFRISRIAEIRPVDGRVVRTKAPPAPEHGPDQGELPF